MLNTCISSPRWVLSFLLLFFVLERLSRNTLNSQNSFFLAIISTSENSNPGSLGKRRDPGNELQILFSVNLNLAISELSLLTFLVWGWIYALMTATFHHGSSNFFFPRAELHISSHLFHGATYFIARSTPFSSWIDGLFARRITIRLFLHGWATDYFFRVSHSRLFLHGSPDFFHVVL